MVARDNKKKTWSIHGTVNEPRSLNNTEDKEKRSYNILVDDGKYILWRNEKYLKHVPTSPFSTRKVTGRISAIKPPSLGAKDTPKFSVSCSLLTLTTRSPSRSRTHSQSVQSNAASREKRCLLTNTNLFMRIKLQSWNSG